jgi:hypothetical protein
VLAASSAAGMTIPADEIDVAAGQFNILAGARTAIDQWLGGSGDA